MTIRSITRSFIVLALFVAMATVAFAQDATVAISDSGDGPFLVTTDGMSLYTFNMDENCTGSCLETWPPYTVESADALSAGENIPGELGTFEREDGSLQVTYRGRPLYMFANDSTAGETLGDGVRDLWWLARPYDITLGSSDELGDFLVAANGLTVYLYTPDSADTSVCVDDCLRIWPPLMATTGEALADPALPGEVGVFERPDGGLQISYQGVPLYYFFGDGSPGSTNGQNFKEVWFVIPPDVPAQ